MVLRSLRWALLWAVLIFVLCTLPGKEIPYHDFWDQFNLDKLIHAGLFFVQAFLLIEGFKRQTKFVGLSRLAKIAAVLIGMIYGGSLELIQSNFIEGRTGSWFDFFANSIGALIAAILFEKVLILKAKFRSSKR